jgi:hypothetical protein
MGSPRAADPVPSVVVGRADRLGYLVVSYGLLAIVAYRALVERTSSWDLLGLVVVGGLVATGYRWLNGKVDLHPIAALLGAAIIAAMVVVVLTVARG